MTGRTRSTPVALWALMIAVTFQGLSGVAGEFGLLTDPSGARLGIPLEWLEGSPFSRWRSGSLRFSRCLGLVQITTPLCSLG